MKISLANKLMPYRLNDTLDNELPAYSLPNYSLPDIAPSNESLSEEDAIDKIEDILANVNVFQRGTVLRNICWRHGL